MYKNIHFLELKKSTLTFAGLCSTSVIKCGQLCQCEYICIFVYLSLSTFSNDVTCCIIHEKLEYLEYGLHKYLWTFSNMLTRHLSNNNLDFHYLCTFITNNFAGIYALFVRTFLDTEKQNFPLF